MASHSRSWLTYLTIMLCVAGVGWLVTLGGRSLFDSLSCRLDGNPSDRFVAECPVGSFGDYDHGAFWFELEPAAIKNLKEADVFFMGNSRTEFAFSTQIVEEYFEQRNIKPYIFSFGYGEPSAFAQALLEKIGKTPKMMIINADPFFSDNLSTASSPLVKWPLITFVQYWIKQKILHSHAAICDAFLIICRDRPSVLHFVRMSKNGFLLVEGSRHKDAKPLSKNLPQPSLGPTDSNFAPTVAHAEAFLTSFNIERRCVVLTGVPTAKSQAEEWAKQLGQALGVTVVQPSVGELYSYDLNHLEPSSAIRWSTAFLADLDPILTKCLQTQR